MFINVSEHAGKKPIKTVELQWEYCEKRHN